MSKRTSKLCGTQKRLRVTHPCTKNNRYQRNSKTCPECPDSARYCTVVVVVVFHRQLNCCSKGASPSRRWHGERTCIAEHKGTEVVPGPLLTQWLAPCSTTPPCHPSPAILYMSGMRIRSGLTKWVRPGEKFIYDFDSYEKYEWALSNYANDLGYIHQVCVRVCYY